MILMCILFSLSLSSHHHRFSVNIRPPKPSATFQNQVVPKLRKIAANYNYSVVQITLDCMRHVSPKFREKIPCGHCKRT